MSVKFETVTVATPMTQLVEWDRDKDVKVRFDPKPLQFRKLSDEELQKLSVQAREAYAIAREENTELAREDADREADIVANIQAGYESGHAGKRLEIRMADTGEIVKPGKPVSKGQRAGYLYQWIRPDMVDDYRDTKGYHVVKDGPERTMANPTGKGPHVISRNGKAELALVMRTVKLDKVARDAKRKRNSEYREAVDQSGIAAVERSGFQGFGDGRQGDFRPVSDRSDE